MTAVGDLAEATVQDVMTFVPTSSLMVSSFRFSGLHAKLELLY